MNAAQKIVNSMKKVNNSNKQVPSQIISATVISKEPLKFQLENRLELDENFYILSNLEDWKNIEIGTKVRAFSYNEGQKYYISEILEDKNYNMFTMNKNIEEILSGNADINFNPEGTSLKSTTISDALKELAASSGGESEGGTYDYDALQNKPSIEGIELEGNKTFEELNLSSLSNLDIEDLINNIVL